MVEMVVCEDTQGHLYLVSRKDFEKMIKNHPKARMQLCELVTVYNCEDYTSFHQALHLNGVFKDGI